MKRAKALRRESPSAQRVPYTAHVAPAVVCTTQGDYVQVFRLDGASFESADDEVLNNWHERLNVLWRNIASPQVALWTHIVRRRSRDVPVGGEGSPFANALAAKYCERLSQETLMVNEIYLSVVYRPVSGVASNWASKLLRRSSSGNQGAQLADALDQCGKLKETLLSSLDRYEPESLRVYEHGHRRYSQILEFLGLLINGERQSIPLPRAPLNEVLSTSRVIVGTEAIEYRSATETRFGAMLGIKEYPTPTVVGMYDGLLSAPFPFVLTQSFTFLTKAAGQSLLQRQYNQMSNAGDFAISQAEELKDALDDLTGNAFVMGDHHLTLQVMTEGDSHVSGRTVERRLQQLNDDVALARSMLADTGMTVAREDLALEAAYWAQLPGCFSLRPRKAPITSRNFSAQAAFHNFPSGRPTGNHWGDALTLLITSASSPYYFSLHASDPTDPEGGSRKDTGHTFICGPTGSGKTVFVGFLVAMLSRQGVTQVLIDRDRGLEILVRAMGGTYLPLKNGAPTNCNPLQLPPTPENVEFLKVWLRSLVGAGLALSVREEADLDHALRGTLALDASARRLSRLIEFTDATRAEGIHARLKRWCASAGGDYAWVFDHAEDHLAADLAATSLFGVDVTDFLDNAATRAPLTLYLFHLIRQLLDGRRLVCWMDEFWRLLADPAFEGFAKDGPKTWRKLNGVMCMATQSPSDVLESAIGRTIIEQTPTKVFFPNSDANAAEYMDGFGLSMREFKLIKEQLEPGSRMFLVKQGHQSIVCELNLKGFDAELKVISGRRSSIEELQQLIAEVGTDSAQWLPRFFGSSVNNG
jgi:type IV secretion system protein VirB4